MSNGFSAADMSTAAANGHAEGYQAGYADAVKAVEAGKPAAAQEAVVWGIRIGASDSWGYTNNEEQADFLGKQSGLPYEKKPLYAAPVAAAPVCADCATPLLYECVGCSATNYPASTPAAPGIDLSCLARFTPILEFGSAQMNYDASGDFVHFEVVRELLSHAGSPSTTLGVDLEPSRELRDKCQRIQENRDFWNGVAEKTREELFQAREELAKGIDASPKGGSDELEVWGTQRPNSMPKLFGARHIAELNWFADEADLVRMRVVERVQATSAEVGGMIRPFQIGDRVRVVYAIASSGHYRAGDVGSVERVSPFSGAARVHFDHFTFNQSVYCYHRELELIEAAGKQPTSHGAGVTND